MARPTARIPGDKQNETEILRRAAAAFDDGAEDFLAHAARDVERAKASLARAESDPGDKRALDTIFSIGHDLKGTGRLFGYGLLTRVGESLCDYLRDRAAGPKKDLRVVRLHVASMAFVVENNIRGQGGEAGVRLLEKLHGARAASA